MKVVVIGSVKTTKHTIKKLIDHKIHVVGIVGYEPHNKSIVSGWVNLKKIAERYNIDYCPFQKINEEDVYQWVKSKMPDVIFAVGFSQLMQEKWLNLPTLGCIGFHPTVLPKGRGRAPIAWSVLCEEFGSATFFKMGKGADDGPIFSQSIFIIDKKDDASSIEKKIEKAIYKSLDNWLPNLKKGRWDPAEQDHTAASWYGKRNPSDGHLDFRWSNCKVDRLIKASSYPHPGAYTYYNDTKLIIWKSEIENEYPIKGVIGSVLVIDKNKGYLVQCGEGLVWLKEIEIEGDIKIKIGSKFGYNIEDEIYLIKKQLRILHEK